MSSSSSSDSSFFSSFKLFAVFRQASRAHLVEETESHVIVLLLGLLFLLLLLGGWSGGCRGGSSGRGSELARIGKVLLELLGLLEGDVGDGGQGQALLYAVDDGVRSRGERRVADLEGDGCDVANAAHEAGAQVVVGDVQDGGVEDGSGVVDVADDQAVSERRDVEHVEERGLGHANLVALLDQVHVLDDLNGSLLDLGRDV